MQRLNTLRFSAVRALDRSRPATRILWVLLILAAAAVGTGAPGDIGIP